MLLLKLVKIHPRLAVVVFKCLDLTSQRHSRTALSKAESVAISQQI